MKNLKPSQLGMVFAGCFLGAGFVSGQELWQFFGAFGILGLPGLLVSICILFAFGVLLLRLSQITGIETMDDIVIPWNLPALKALAAGLQCLFLFGVATIMTAGAGALLHQLFGVPVWLACLAMIAALALTALSGLRGMTRVFSVSVPLIVLATIIFAGISFAVFGISSFSIHGSSTQNPLLPNWIIAAPTYAAYNIFGSIGILAPLHDHLPKRRKVYAGIAIGAAALLCIAAGVLCSLFLYPASVQAELPMLALTSAIHPVCGYLYGVLLLAGMFGNALSALVAIQSYLVQKFPAVCRCPSRAIAVISVLCYTASLAGFGTLVGTVYPLFGYLSIALLLCLIAHYCMAVRKNAHKSSESPDAARIS